MTVSALCSSYPSHDSEWYLEVNHFDGDHWQDSQAEGLWIALTPHLADGATLEFEDEEGDRWRIRWHKGHLFQERVKRVVWDISREITPPQKEFTS